CRCVLYRVKVNSTSADPRRYVTCHFPHVPGQIGCRIAARVTDVRPSSPIVLAVGNTVFMARNCSHPACAPAGTAGEAPAVAAAIANAPLATAAPSNSLRLMPKRRLRDPASSYSRQPRLMGRHAGPTRGITVALAPPQRLRLDEKPRHVSCPLPDCTGMRRSGLVRCASRLRPETAHCHASCAHRAGRRARLHFSRSALDAVRTRRWWASRRVHPDRRGRSWSGICVACRSTHDGRGPERRDPLRRLTVSLRRHRQWANTSSLQALAENASGLSASSVREDFEDALSAARERPCESVRRYSGS